MQNGASKSVAALALAMKNAQKALDRSAPAPGQHVFCLGERLIMHDLKQRADLNGCIATVRNVADNVEGDGRVEVSVGSGGKARQNLKLKPGNLRLEWHAVADVHVTSVGAAWSSTAPATRRGVKRVVGFPSTPQHAPLLCKSRGKTPAMLRAASAFRCRTWYRLPTAISPKRCIAVR